MRIGRAAAAVVNAAYRSWGTLTLIGADRSVFDVDKVAGGGAALWSGGGAWWPGTDTAGMTAVVVRVWVWVWVWVGAMG